jgi:hypothetical protein
MSETDPIPLKRSDWLEIMAVPAVRDAWGLEIGSDPDEFALQVYAAKFRFTSGGPGYVGALYVLQGGALTDDGTMILRRDTHGSLIVSK